MSHQTHRIIFEPRIPYPLYRSRRRKFRWNRGTYTPAEYRELMKPRFDPEYFLAVDLWRHELLQKAKNNSAIRKLLYSLKDWSTLRPKWIKNLSSLMY